MPAGKGFWTRVAERYRIETSTESFKRQQRSARIQAALILIVTLPTIGIFWRFQWSPSILAALVVGAGMVVVFFGSRFRR